MENKMNNNWGLLGGNIEREFIELIVYAKMNAQGMNDNVIWLCPFPVLGVSS